MDHQAGNVTAHFQYQNRHGKDEADPEPPGHVDQFGVRFLFSDGDQWFERHATYRAVPWLALPDLGVHWAGIDRAWLRGWLRCAGRHTADRLFSCGMTVAIIRAGKMAMMVMMF